MTTAAPASFYRELVSRNTGFISATAQAAIRDARVLVAGCGSTGGAVIEPLVRIGVQDFVLADNGAYELNNLNRQHATVADIGRNKAEVGGELIRNINPYASVEVRTRGIEPGTVDESVAGCAVVIDGVDVTERSGLQAKWALHVSAARQRVPVVSGYDMAGMQFVRYYDYRLPSKPMDGAITAEHIETDSPIAVLARLIPQRKVPIEMIRSLRLSVGRDDTSVSQLVYTSLMFGAIASRITVEALTGTPVRRQIGIDLHRSVRRPRANGWLALHRPIDLVRTLRALNAARPERIAP